MKQYFLRLWSGRYVLTSLVKRDLQLKYRNSMLGVAWSILTPIGLAIIVGSVYSIIFGNNPAEFIPLLFASINPWAFMSGTADAATVSLIGAEGYIKQTSVQCEIYPLRTASVSFVNLCYTILAFFAIYLFIQPDLYGPKMLMVFPGLAIVFIFAWGTANLTAIINLFVRDFQPLQSIMLQGFFYATPIIFPTEVLDERGFSLIYQLNPFYYILEVVRRPMLGQELPECSVYVIAIAISVIIFIISIFFMEKYRDKIVFSL